MRNSEARIQAEIVAWARQAAPHVVIFAVPNDGLFTKAEAAKRKWTGVLAGVPDIVVIETGGRAHFIEVKQPGFKPSDEQRAVIARLVDLGARCAIVRSLNEAKSAFADWKITVTELESA